MGEILFLAHRLPYPPDRGDRIRSWHVLQALAKIAPVHVAALIDDEADRVHVAKVASIAASVSIELRQTSKLRAMALALARGTPASVEAFRSRALKAKVDAILAGRPIDCIYAFSSQMAAYVPTGFEGQFVMDFVDMDSAKFAQMGGLANRQEARRLLTWEIAAAKRADLSLFVSQAEAALFVDRTRLPATVLGNGIDLARFDPAQVIASLKTGPLIVFTGQMDYSPNVEAVVDFARHALPEILRAVPDVKFAIVGRAPVEQVWKLANKSVIVTGEVADTRPWLAAADVVVAPLKLARGVQNKVLEAMAMGRAVVASRAAALGIAAVDGRDLIVADEPATLVIELLRDRRRSEALGLSARKLMIDRYSWDAQMAPLAGMIVR
ncbi:MAG: family PEP-CTERM/XrtA system glycosyltransferase [Sphingomonadales bacterium]|nr:family PEP-CTERM/XrtA system glycosyltransferase [Sphingomonadales bacterium]